MGGFCGAEEERSYYDEKKPKVSIVRDKRRPELKKELPLIKIVLVGDTGVGKTSILRRLNRMPFDDSIEGTVAVDFAEVVLKSEKKKVKLQIWDTAGQERFRSIIKNYYRGAHCICLVFDVTSPTSFKNISKWIKNIRNNLPEDEKPCFILMGNKCDLVHARQVSRTMAKRLGEGHEFLVNRDCSAKDNFNIKKTFKAAVRRLQRNEEDDYYE